MQAVLKHLARATGAAAAAGADAQLLAQFSQRTAAFGDGAADIAFRYGVTNADVHGRGSELFCKDQLALTGAPQAVGFVAVGDQNFVPRAEQRCTFQRGCIPGRDGLALRFSGG
jgi:hypothetical protein